MPDIACDRSRLIQLLDESLPELDEQALSSHLDQCDMCRRELESIAANETWWMEARERLSRDLGNSQIQEIHGLSHDDREHDFTIDFAVDFLEPSQEETSLGRLGEYEIVEIIGRGGMGIVLKGYQKELHRHVAVKVLSPHLASSGAARKRFAREAQATAAVVHPHVMAIHSVNATAKLPYLVMPYVPCESLQERIDKHGPFAVVDILRIGHQAALGLAAAHAQGLVHRDVKPANILLETNVDRVLLTDFGLARSVDDAMLTRTGIIAGTPQYMSPEQANGDGVDHRSDLFSLGGVLYAMCTGRPPFRAETTFGVLRKIRETSPRSIRDINPDIPDWLERIVMKLLAKDVSDRFTTAAEIATLLENCLAHVQQPTAVPLPTCIGDWPLLPPITPLTAIHSFANFRWRLRLPLIVGGILCLVALMYFFGPRESEKQDANPDTTPGNHSAEASPDTPLEWNSTQSGLDAVEFEIEQLEVNDERFKHAEK